MRLLIKFVFALVFLLAIIYSCTKDKGRNPALAYTDNALRDSCQNTSAFVYYKNDPGTLHAGSNGPHGSFKIRFNHKAYAQLTDGGKLPVGGVFTDGSMIVKDIIRNGNLVKYAIMYKLKGAWLWGEWTPDLKTKDISVNDNSSLCTSCHSQAGNRDLVNTFSFH